MSSPDQQQVYFTDEMRYGTRTHSKQRWTVQGDRPVCPVHIGYQWGYLYVALCPFSGDIFSMLFTHLDKACFACFLEHLQTHLRKHQRLLNEVLLIGDGATAHTAQDWTDVANLVWKKLPTACPELNPVERFFQELRRKTSNRVFTKKEEVEKLLSNLMQEYMNQPEKVCSLTLFPYIKSSSFN
ncbi:MAG: transposase [Bacteroidota bacterium]